MKTFKCDMCGGRFEDDGSDEQRASESQELFPEVKPEDMAQVCGDCFQKLNEESQFL